MATGVVAAPAGRIDELTEPVALEPTATVAGKSANAAAMSAATAATLNSAVSLAGSVSLPAPVVAVRPRQRDLGEPDGGADGRPGRQRGRMPVKLATPVAGS